ncbi:K+ efflux antiporter 1 [Actinidia rufa]|uniref:K+ efflux antiporter 1 n=1 Tax=Actinidia rufa TaxID=165716 RepID=A0A7J0HD41_9ERIC|nr:K+ efflux antiporter 1 [Actinidia rufa]
MFHGCESTSCRTLDRFNSHLKFKIRGIGCNFLGNPRKLKLKKIGSVNLGVLIKRDLNSHLWGYSSCGPSIGDFVNDFKKSRGVRTWCQGSDSIAYIDGNGRNVESVESHSEESVRGEAHVSPESNGSGEIGEEEDKEGPSLDELRELFQMALKELEVSRLNSSMFEEKAQRISEAAIALKDEAANARDNVDSTIDFIQEIANEETVAKEAVQKATMALSLAEARLQVAVDSIEAAKGRNDLLEAYRESESGDEGGGEESKPSSKEEEEFFAAQDDIRACRATLENCEGELRRLQSRKEELQKEVDRLNGVAEKAQMNALKAEEDVANIMLLAEQAVAFEIEAAQSVSDAEIALQRAESSLSISHVDDTETIVHQNGSSSQGQVLSEEELIEEGKVNQGDPGDSVVEMEREVPIEGALIIEPLPGIQLDGSGQNFEEPTLSNDSDQENGRLSFESSRDNDIDSEKTKNVAQTKKQELQKDLPRDSSPLNAPKALLKKSSRFFSASFFSLEGSEFTPVSLFNGLIESARKELPKLIVGSLLVGAGVAFYANRAERINQLFLQPGIITTSIDEVSSNAKPLVNEEEASLFDMLWLLLASVIFVPIFQKIPGGN